MIPALDNRNRKELLKHIKAVSESYTPEWRFDEEDPDPGATLAMIYADLFDGSIRRFNRIPEKYRIAFYNEINADLLPSVPSFGYVSFDLAGSLAEGAPVRKGTQLTAESTATDIGYTVFETQNDVCVMEAEPVVAICTNGEADHISYAYEEDPSDEEQHRSFRPFDISEGNVQQHVMHFCADHLLNIKHGAWIELSMDPHYIRTMTDEMLEALTDDSLTKWEFFSEKGWMEFSAKKVDDGRILFFKSAAQPAFELLEADEKESYWIRCTVNDVSRFEEMHLDCMTLSAMGAGIEPDGITSIGMDQDIHEFFAFGPDFSIYNEMYISCSDAFCKKGAKVRMDFTLKYATVPIDLDVADPAINWKLVMKRNKIKLDEEYDITVAKVIWEYFNGYGWAKLFELTDQEELFNVDAKSEEETSAKFVSFEFTCPKDMEKVVVNAAEGYFIRARVIKVNNAYKIKGNYISPVIEGMTLSYTYGENRIIPDRLMLLNNTETAFVEQGELIDSSYFFTPFSRVEGDKTAVYIGFTETLKGGPVRMLITLQEMLSEKTGRMKWEYYGRRGWNTLNIADDTENLRKSGIVTFIGPSDMSRKELWNRDLFWLRITDEESTFGGAAGSDRQQPEITDIFMNATEIKNIESGQLELFHVDQGSEEYECVLLNQNIQDIEVEVLEEDGWHLWEEVSDFSSSDTDSRHYTADRNNGKIRFSNGARGRIPPAGDSDTIRVRYSMGGGERGNLPQGAVNGSRYSIGFIDKISNPGVTFGGCDIETAEHAAKRTASAIKHGGRAVSASDFEALALEASRNIVRAKCFSGYNDRGKRQPGAVTVIVLQRDFASGRDYFNAIRKQVEEYLEPRISGDLIEMERFFVCEPQFLELCVKAELTVDSYNKVFDVKDAVKEGLDEFLDPLHGNFDGQGWPIGKIPNSTQIINCMKKIKDIKYIRNVYVTAIADIGSGRVETDLESLKDRVFALPLSGIHEITVIVDEGR